MKKILFICSNSPFEHSYGAQQRTNLLFNTLCDVATVDVICFTNDAYPSMLPPKNCEIKYFGELPFNHESGLKRRFNKLVNLLNSFSPYSVYAKNSFATKMTNNLIQFNHYDYIVVRYIHNAYSCGLAYNKDIIVDVDDLPEQTLLSYLNSINASNLKRLQYNFYAKRAKYHTNAFLKKIKHSFFPNEEQCQGLNASYLPNIPYPTQNLAKQNPFEFKKDIVLFIGLMSHTPNFLGVDSFISNIWPIVTKSNPNAIFRIIGKGLTDEQIEKWELVEGVQVVGFVENLQEEYNRSKVVVVPIYHGAGTNIKVLEAMYMRKTCVISSIALRGLSSYLIDNQNILIAKDNIDFASKITKSIINDTLNQSIANQAYETIEKYFSLTTFKTSVLNYISR